MNQILQLIKDNYGKTQPLNVIRNQDEASLYIYDIIDPYWGVSAQGVISELNKVGDAKVLNVFINSAGGSVFEARAIMAAIQRFQGEKVAHIDSLCASAATSIALSCDRVEMSDGAFFMIHNASGVAYGDKSVMRETADLLEKVEGSIVADYVSKTGKDAQEIIDLMNQESWFSAQEALDNGFIDVIKESPSAVKNTWNLSAFNKVPDALKPKEEPQQETIEPAQKAGFFMSTANRNKLKLLTSL